MKDILNYIDGYEYKIDGYNCYHVVRKKRKDSPHSKFHFCILMMCMHDYYIVSYTQKVYISKLIRKPHTTINGNIITIEGEILRGCNTFSDVTVYCDNEYVQEISTELYFGDVKYKITDKTQFICQYFPVPTKYVITIKVLPSYNFKDIFDNLVMCRVMYHYTNFGVKGELRNKIYNKNTFCIPNLIDL